MIVRGFRPIISAGRESWKARDRRWPPGREPRGRAKGGYRRLCQSTAATLPLPQRLRQPAEDLRRVAQPDRFLVVDVLLDVCPNAGFLEFPPKTLPQGLRAPNDE